jgi:type VI secretion system secreted protein Hcp
MPEKFLLTMTLKKQGAIKGSSTKKEGDLDFSKGLECHAFNYEVLTPIDSKSGQPAGKRQHNPITIIRESDSASPKLLQALANGEVFSVAKLQFNRIGQDGKPRITHTIELTNGTVCRVKQTIGSGGKPCDNVTLAYEGLLVNGVPNARLPHVP